jgi:hypothetical protein
MKGFVIFGVLFLSLLLIVGAVPTFKDPDKIPNYCNLKPYLRKQCIQVLLRFVLDKFYFKLLE